AVPCALPGGDRGRAAAVRGADRGRRPGARRSRGRRRAVRSLRPAHPGGPARAAPAQRPPALPRPPRPARMSRPGPDRRRIPATDPPMKDDVSTPDTPAPDASGPAPLDQTERVILRAAEEESGTGCPCDLVVVGDSTGALTAAALDSVSAQQEARVWSWNASRCETTALAERFADEVRAGRVVLAAEEDPAPLEEFAAGSDAHLVLARLPKSLAGLDDLARRAARLASRAGREDLTLIAGGRVKHMTRSQNDVLAGSFTEVRASRGLGKSRALIASGPRPDAAAPQPAAGAATVRVRGQERGLALRGSGGVFGRARAEAGSLLLLDALDAALVAGEVTAQRAVDLGSGNGLLTAHLAAALPGAQVLGSDDDA